MQDAAQLCDRDGYGPDCRLQGIPRQGVYRRIGVGILSAGAALSGRGDASGDEKAVGENSDYAEGEGGEKDLCLYPQAFAPGRVLKRNSGSLAGDSCKEPLFYGFDPFALRMEDVGRVMIYFRIRFQFGI